MINSWLEEREQAEKEQAECEAMEQCPIYHGALGFAFQDPRYGYSDYQHNIPDCVEEAEFKRYYARFAKENGFKFDDEHGDPWILYYPSSNPIYYSILRCTMLKNDRRNAIAKVESLYEQLDESAVFPIVQNAGSIRQSPDKLKEYIHSLFTLETSIYSLGKRLADLYAQRAEYERNVRRRNGLIEFNIRQQSSDSENEYHRRQMIFDSVQETKLDIAEPAKPVLAKPGLFNKKKVLAQNAELSAEYERAFAEYQKNKREVEEDLARELTAAKEQLARAKAQMEQHKIRLSEIDAETEAARKLPSHETVSLTMVTDEIAQAEKIFKELIECRNKLYAYNVVFSKYRNLVALATFYEYLLAGRCTALERTDGAYNIFEVECRANQIIGQLTKIVQSLEKIKESQYLIYSELRGINNSLNRMNATMSNMAKSLQAIKVDTHNISGYMETVAKNSDVIAHNTAVSAYYSKMNAELTNSLGYLVALH